MLSSLKFRFVYFQGDGAELTVFNRSNTHWQILWFVGTLSSACWGLLCEQNVWPWVSVWRMSTRLNKDADIWFPLDNFFVKWITGRYGLSLRNTDLLQKGLLPTVYSNRPVKTSRSMKQSPFYFWNRVCSLHQTPFLEPSSTWHWSYSF